MKALYLSSLMLCLCAWPAKPAFSVAPSVTLTIPNQVDPSPPCTVTLPAREDQCTDNFCKLPLPKGASLKIHLTCLPVGSLTGIERPPPEAWEESVRVGRSNINLLLMDGYRGTPEEGTRSIDFCFIGRKSYFCGAATTPKLKLKARREATTAVKAFIKGVEWPEALPSPRVQKD